MFRSPRTLVVAVLVTLSFLGCPGPDESTSDAGGNVGGGSGGGNGAGGGGGSTEQDSGQPIDAGDRDSGILDPADSGNWPLGDGGIAPGFDGGPARQEIVCAASGWCYSYPYPHGLPVNSIVPDGPNALWAVSPAAI